MFIALLIGSFLLVLNMAIQVLALVVTLGFLIRRLDSGDATPGLRTDMGALCVVLAVLYVGHLLQFGSWALLFFLLGEFQDFQTAFYHSTVNFTSLGYGDIVMSPRWRLLGGLEAANGVLMLGLSGGAVLSTMSRLFSRRKAEITRRLDRNREP